MSNTSLSPEALNTVAENNARNRSSYGDLLRLSQKYDKEGGRILDVGIHGDVYPGGHAFLFDKAKYETLDIDSNVMPTHVGDIRSLEFESNTFDLIICHSVIEHVLERRTEAYKELYRVLQEGGTIYYCIPTTIDERETEEARYVSHNKLQEEHNGLEYKFKYLKDKNMVLEVTK